MIPKAASQCRKGLGMHKRLILGCVALALLVSSAFADTMPQDPAAGVESGNFSTGISKFVGQFNPTDNNGIIGFFNDTGAIITSLSLHTTIAKSLTAADISDSFSCNSATDPFFLNCGFVYNSSNGSLTINFFGVNRPDGDELNGRDAEIGEHEGIPAVPAACLPNPNASGCNVIGHFAFVFNDGFLQTGNLVDEWVPGTLSSADHQTKLFNGQPLFDAPGFTTAPEPSSLILLGSAAIFALARLSRRRAR